MLKTLKIILYPHTTSIFSSKKIKKIINKKLNRNNLFLSSCKDLSYFKNKFNKHNIYICGYPKYEIKWLKIIENFLKKIQKL